jgi:hypothetical protein
MADRSEAGPRENCAPCSHDSQWQLRGSGLAPRSGRNRLLAGLSLTLLRLHATRQAVAGLLGQTRSPRSLGIVARRRRGFADRLGGGRLGHRCASSGASNSGRLGNRLRRLAQFSQRRALAHSSGSGISFAQRALAGLARYVIGHDSADQGLTAAPAGGIEAIGGIVGNQNRTSPEALTMKRPAFSHRLQGLADQPQPSTTVGNPTAHWHFAIFAGMLAGSMSADL